MTTYEPENGSIVHVELYSDDVEATRSFFEDAFGWSFEPVEGMDYTMWRSSDPPFGGLLGAEAAPDAFPPVLCYLQTDDLERTVEAIEAAGGEVLHDDEVPGMGVFAVFRAPGGVVEAVWQSTGDAEPPEEGWPEFIDEPGAGSVVHVELYTDDVDATRAFHEAVFGWTFEDLEGDYVMASPSTPPRGGLMEASDEMPVGTLCYVLVEGAEASCEAIEAAGGTVVEEPFDIEGWGTMAVFEAPGGIVGAVWESAMETSEAAAEERAGKKATGA